MGLATLILEAEAILMEEEVKDRASVVFGDEAKAADLRAWKEVLDRGAALLLAAAATAVE